MKICACIAEKTAEDCIKVARALDTDFVEHRMDFMEKIENLDKIYSAINIPIIATNRSVACKGYFKGTEEDRIEHLINAIDAGCVMVDIELSVSNKLKKKVIHAAKKNKCKIIISFHDWNHTPNIKELLKIMLREKEEGADIGKIVTTANSLGDCHRVLGLLLEAQKEDFPLIAFSMGKLGKFTRPMSLLFGAPFTFAALDKKTAPGQLSVNEIRNILRGLT